MGITNVIAELYRRGIDCGLESFRAAGVLAWVVDERNRRIEKHFDIERLESVEEWLVAEASRQYDSQNGSTHEPTTRALLAELTGSERKDPKRITSRDRSERQTGGAQARGTHS